MSAPLGSAGSGDVQLAADSGWVMSVFLFVMFAVSCFWSFWYF
jgi:hypothetical protein